MCVCATTLVPHAMRRWLQLYILAAFYVGFHVLSCIVLLTVQHIRR
jgi:hypothetical protein